jgi:hypothetical protein
MPTDHPTQVKRSSFQIRLRIGGILGQALQYHPMTCTNVHAGTNHWTIQIFLHIHCQESK